MKTSYHFLFAAIACVALLWSCDPEKENDPDPDPANYVEVDGVKHTILAATQNYDGPWYNNEALTQIQFGFQCADLDLDISVFCSASNKQAPAGNYAATIQSAANNCSIYLRNKQGTGYFDANAGSTTVTVAKSGDTYTFSLSNCPLRYTADGGSPVTKTVTLVYSGTPYYGTDEFSGSGSFLYNGTKTLTVNASEGGIEQWYYGDAVGNGTSYITLDIYNDDFYIYLGFVCAAGSDRIPSGTYNFSSAAKPSAGSLAEGECSVQLSEGVSEYGDITAGSATVVRTGNSYAITLTGVKCTLPQGIGTRTFSGTYNGTTGWYYGVSYWDDKD